MKLTDLIQNIKKAVPANRFFADHWPDSWATLKGNLCLCPFHDDKETLSLQIDAKFAYCHGCHKKLDVVDLCQEFYRITDVKEACDKLIAEYNLDHLLEEKPKNENWITYPYVDERSELLFEVVRKPGKDFKQRRPDPGHPGKWLWNLGDTHRVLYRLPAVLQASTVWVCEGEKDANSLVALGLCGTTSPQGAGKWKGLVDKYRIHEPLKSKNVYIIPDNDKPGKSHAQDIASSLYGVSASVKILPLPGLPEKADVSDFIELCGLEEAKRQLLEIAERTPEYKPARSGPEILSCRELVEKEITEPRWLVQGLLPEGLSLLVAKPKTGKSWLCQDLALSVAQGTSALSHFQTNQATSLNLCLEDNHRRMKKRLTRMLGDSPPPETHLIACEWPAFDRGGLELLHKTLDDNPDIKLVTIDTWGRFRPRRGRTDDVYSSDYADLQPLHSLATLFQIAILLVHHSRKETSDDAVDSILGSTALSGAADSLLILKRKSRSDLDAVLFVSGRDIADQEHALSFDAGIWRYKGNPLELQLTTERREIREAIAQTGKPMTPTEIAKLTGRKLSATHSLLSKMVDAGEIDRGAQRGRYVLPPEDELYGSSRRRYRADETFQEEIYLDQI